MITIGIVAHEQRRTIAEQLAATVNAHIVSIDNGTLGCDNNHKRVYSELAQSDTEWVCVLEDDVVPVITFTGQLHKIATVAPTNIVSLYAGRTRPPQFQARLGQAIHKAEENNCCFITADRLLSAQGVLIRTALIPDMLANLKRWLPIDEAISRWAQRAHHLIAYTVPSIIEHRDLPTLIRHRDNKPRPPGRTAWTVGTRSTWTADTIPW
mgnify:CR=1 FL=1